MDEVEKPSTTLPPEMARTIKATAEASTYASISEAVCIWQRQEEEHEEPFAAIRARVKRSLADTRPDVPMAEVLDRLARHHADTMKCR